MSRLGGFGMSSEGTIIHGSGNPIVTLGGVARYREDMCAPAGAALNPLPDPHVALHPLPGRIFIERLAPRHSAYVHVVNAAYEDVEGPASKTADVQTEAGQEMELGQVRADVGRVVLIHDEDVATLGLRRGSVVLMRQFHGRAQTWVDCDKEIDRWGLRRVARRMRYWLGVHERTAEDLWRGVSRTDYPMTLDHINAVLDGRVLLTPNQMRTCSYTMGVDLDHKETPVDDEIQPPPKPVAWVCAETDTRWLRGVLGTKGSVTVFPPEGILCELPSMPGDGAVQ